MIEQTISRAVNAAISGGRGLYSAGQRVRRATRRGRNPTRTSRSAPLTFTRTAAPATITLVAGEAASFADFALTQVQTSDLIGMYDMYKINSVRIRLIPLYDPGQSGVTNNTDVWIAAAGDPTASAPAAPTWAQVAAFDNAKVSPIVAGREFTYTLRPKALNALAGGNYAVNNTDWMVLSTLGAAVSHYRWYYNIKSQNASATTAYVYTVEYNFTVKQAS